MDSGDSHDSDAERLPTLPPFPWISDEQRVRALTDRFPELVAAAHRWDDYVQTRDAGRPRNHHNRQQHRIAVLAFAEKTGAVVGEDDHRPLSSRAPRLPVRFLCYSSRLESHG
jgi:hypothetical protein